MSNDKGQDTMLKRAGLLALLSILVACALASLPSVRAIDIPKPPCTGGFEVLYQFGSNHVNGVYVTGCSPESGLVRGSDGWFYGTTAGGTVNGACTLGTVFKVNSAGVLTNLYLFTGACDEGNPTTPLIQGSDGYFYGSTTLIYAEAPNCPLCPPDCMAAGNCWQVGEVFRISSSGTFTVMHGFSNCAYLDTNEGNTPRTLLQVGNMLIGTTLTGAGGPCYGHGCVFGLTNVSGAFTGYTKLYNFQGICRPTIDDGSNPSGLIAGPDGWFYGTTRAGGSTSSANYDHGTVFKFKPGVGEVILHSFDGGAEGRTPGGGLVRGSDGDFYGTTTAEGDSECSCGTVFKIHPDGTGFVTLHTFTGPDGCHPFGGYYPGDGRLIQASDGNFYGTTYGGEVGYNYYNGTVFKITSSGTLTTLHTFTGCPDGAHPAASSLVDGKDGWLYGTTEGGGMGLDGCNPSPNVGVVFRICIPH